MSSLLLAACAATGVYLLFTSEPPGPRTERPGLTSRAWAALHARLRRAGLPEVSPWGFGAASLAAGTAAALPAAALFGAGPASALVGAGASFLPAATWRQRRAAARRAARDAWPQLIEEVRVLTGSGGRSLPQALLDVGLRGPEELRPAFLAAQREWALTTDFERTTSVLKDHLADPTADATCETLLVAAEVGGDVDRRLRALAEDRRQDLIGRKEARSRQAGARLARGFVVVVPAGMAVAGLSVGEGGQAYRTPTGQLLVAAGIALVVVCWVWASRIMRLPEPARVLDR